ncbi:MAG: SDR family oxidoreductase [Bacteroidetes bacterium]|nr:SDR family oxidoreductase [Bacteroidota bacterium]
MKIFVTGGTGYLGNQLVTRLSALGNEIHAVCHDPVKRDLLQLPGVSIYDGDIRDGAFLKRAMQECTQVYHLAAYAQLWAKDKSTYYTVNVEGTRHVLDAALEAGIEKMVYTSTAGVLGPSSGIPVRETDQRIGEILNEYEDSKTIAENLCMEYTNQKGLPVTIVNPPRIYGPGLINRNNWLTKLIQYYLEGKWKFIPGNGEGIGSYVYIDDIIQGHILAMEKGKPGERYILSGENVSYNHFFKTLEKISGIKRNLIKLPLPVMLLAGQMMLLKTRLTGKPPLLTPVWIKKYSLNWALDCEKAKHDLGYSYISLEEGLTKTMDWLKEKSNLPSANKMK